MNEDQFFDRLREDARPLQFEPDAFMTMRIAARVRERIDTAPTVSLFLARWLRPIAASLSALALVACVSVAWIEQRSTNGASLDSLSASNGMEISVDGDTYSVGY